MEMTFGVSEHRIYQLAEKIKPVVRFKRKKGFFGLFRKSGLRYIKPGLSLFIQSFWRIGKPAGKATGLRPICDIETRHDSIQWNRLFCPTVAEILAQIPEKYHKETAAFEIISYTPVKDTNYNIATVRLYRRI